MKAESILRKFLPLGCTVIAFLISGQSPVIRQAFSQNQVQPSTEKERRLYEQYVSFLETLDRGRIESEYPAAIRKIQSGSPDDQQRGLAVLRESGEVDVIAWIVPLLDSENDSVRIYAGLALENIVSRNELSRRDMTHPEKIVILPRSDADKDLRPLGWVVLKMMKAPDDGNTAAYAATMAGYLGLAELEEDLRDLLKSRHPAVRRSASHALESLSISPESPESRKIPGLSGLYRLFEGLRTLQTP